MSNTHARKFKGGGGTPAAKQLGPMERIAQLEEGMQTIFLAFNDQKKRQDALMGTLAAIESILGVDVVQARADELLVLRAQESIVAAIGRGEIAPAEVITEQGVLVGVLTDSNGAVQRPGRLQFDVASLREEIREALIGKGVGATAQTPDGATFSVLEIYAQVPPSEPASPPVAPEPVVDAVFEEIPAGQAQ